MTAEPRQQYTDEELKELARELVNRPRAEAETIIRLLKMSLEVEKPGAPEQAKALFSALCAEVQDKTVKTFPELQRRMDAIAAILPREGAQK